MSAQQEIKDKAAEEEEARESGTTELADFDESALEMENWDKTE